jgi:hypothetical protein
LHYSALRFVLQDHIASLAIGNVQNSHGRLGDVI